jgi:polyisoprenoid-binding protein YceI
LFSQCTKDASSISGTVTYLDAIPADGAIVTLSSDEAGETVISSVVCAADGHYTIPGLLEGTYYLRANYNTANVNNLKAAGFNFATSEAVGVEVSGDVSQDLSMVNAAAGTDVINTVDETWTFDKAHSNINWSTAYVGENALLTGKFNSFSIDVNFDEANPTATTISASVQLSSANTGEPGRDNLGNCLNGYLGVVTDTLNDGSYFVSDESTDVATYVSKTVSEYGDGYKAVGDFTFKGITKSVDLFFNYIGQADYSADGDGSNIRGGITGEFEFLALSDFLVTSTSIGDKINVKVNANFRKANN